MRFYYTNQTVDRKVAREVELKIEEQTGLELRNPFYDDEAKEVKSLDSTGITHLSHDEIVGMDLRKIRECDGILAYMTNDRNIGSCMEIAIAAHSWGKKVFVICTQPHIYNHPWIQHFATAMFKNHYEFIKYARITWPKPEKKPKLFPWL